MVVRYHHLRKHPYLSSQIAIDGVKPRALSKANRRLDSWAAFASFRRFHGLPLALKDKAPLSSGMPTLITLPETKQQVKAPENRCLEDYVPFGITYFQVLY